MIVISFPFELEDSSVYIKTLDISCDKTKVKQSIEKLLGVELNYFEVKDNLIICDKPEAITAKIFELEPTVEMDRKKKIDYKHLSMPSNAELLRYGN